MPPKKPFIVVVESSIGYDKPDGGRTKSLNVLKKLYDALGVEVIVISRLKHEDETRRGFNPKNTTKAKLLASGRQEYKKDMNKKTTRKVKISSTQPQKKLTSGELRKLISNHNKLTKIKIPKGTDYDGLVKIITDAGLRIDHENKRLVGPNVNGKSTIIPLPKPDTAEQKEEKKKIAVEKKRQKEIKVLTDKNVKKQEKKDVIKGALALKKLVGKRQEKKKENKENKKEIENNMKNNRKYIERFIKKWKDGKYSFKGNGESKAIDDKNFFSPLTLDKFQKGMENISISSMDITPNYKSTDRFSSAAPWKTEDFKKNPEMFMNSYSYEIKYYMPRFDRYKEYKKKYQVLTPTLKKILLDRNKKSKK